MKIMHTSAHLPQATCSMAYEGTLCAPVELRATEGGQYAIVLELLPSKSALQTIVAHVPVEPGETARRQAELQVQRINAAQKHGANAIQICAPLAQHRLICRAAKITAFESHHPASAAPEKAPEVHKVADLFEAAAA